MGLPDDENKNVALHDDTSSSTDLKPISTTVDGPKRRLDVDASITGSVTISTTQPRWDYSVSPTSLTNGVDTSIFSIPATTGFIDFVQVVCKNSSFSAIIIIDGVEQLRISQDDLGTIGLLSSNSTGIPIYAASASKIFTLHPNQPFNFATSFELQVVASSGGNSVDGFMVTWREAV
jgi:hypothetical protein